MYSGCKSLISFVTCKYFSFLYSTFIGILNVFFIGILNVLFSTKKCHTSSPLPAIRLESLLMVLKPHFPLNNDIS